VDEIPLGTTGKTGRRALRELASKLSLDNLRSVSGATKHSAYGTNVPLRGASNEDSKELQDTPDENKHHGTQHNLSEVEQILMDCWAQVLGRTDIDPNDSFFVLGGDSIKAIRLVGVARPANLRLSVFFARQNPVFRRMDSGAEIVQPASLQPIEPWSPVGGRESAETAINWISEQIKVAKDAIEDIFPVTPYQKSTFLDSLRIPGTCVLPSHYRVHEGFDIDRFRQVWLLVSKRFQILRTRVVRPRVLDIVQVVLWEPEDLKFIQFDTEDAVEPYLKQTRLTMTRFGAPLVEGKFIKIQGTYSFHWSIHHSIYDSPIRRAIRNALGEAYEGDSSPTSPSHCSILSAS
jgi:hypothetical protein